MSEGDAVIGPFAWLIIFLMISLAVHLPVEPAFLEPLLMARAPAAGRGASAPA